MDTPLELGDINFEWQTLHSTIPFIFPVIPLNIKNEPKLRDLTRNTKFRNYKNQREINAGDKGKLRVMYGSEQNWNWFEFGNVRERKWERGEVRGALDLKSGRWIIIFSSVRVAVVMSLPLHAFFVGCFFFFFFFGRENGI